MSPGRRGKMSLLFREPGKGSIAERVSMPDMYNQLPWLSAHAQTHLRAALGARPRGLLTDVDGTISAIAPAPAAAVLLPGVAGLLTKAASAFDIVAAVSGRSALDARRLVGVPELTYIGNHGLERLNPVPAGQKEGAYQPHIHPDAAPFIGAINATLDEARQALEPRFPGMVVEKKGVTGSIHVRQTAEPTIAEAAAARMVGAIAASQGLRVTRGKLVIEVRPPLEIDKGTAITELIRSAGLRSALYLGDDRTDIDAFRALHRLASEGNFQGVAIAVLHAEAPANLAAEADLALDSIEHVPLLLDWILAVASPC